MLALLLILSKEILAWRSVASPGFPYSLTRTRCAPPGYKQPVNQRKMSGFLHQSDLVRHRKSQTTIPTNLELLWILLSTSTAQLHYPAPSLVSRTHRISGEY